MVSDVFWLGPVEVPVDEGGAGETRGPKNDQVVLLHTSVPWDRDGGRVSGVVDVVVMSELVNPGGTSQFDDTEFGTLNLSSSA